MSKCLVASLTGADRIILMRWIFASLASSPDVQDLAKVTPEQRHALTLQAGSIFSRLMTETCRAQTVAALKNEGMDGFGAGFSAMGAEAMGALASQPGNQKELMQASQSLDWAKMDSVIRDAGMTPPARK